MSRSAKSLCAFAVYLVVLGGTLVGAPNALLTLFAYPTTGDVWIRVVGMLCILLAFYYVQMARTEMATFFRWTVYARASVILFFLVFVVLGLAKPILILFGTVDLAGALWTQLTLGKTKA